MYPVVSYILPLLSYIELLSPVLDAFEVEAQVTLILFSLAASLAFLNEMVQALSYSLFSSARRSSESDKAESLRSTSKDLAHGNKVSTSRNSAFTKLLNASPFLKNSTK